MAPYDMAREIFARARPSAVFRPQSPTDWQGDFPLPDPVAGYFAELGPVDVWIRGYGNPYCLPSLSGLWRFQAGYRYHADTQERFSEWDDGWLVIADEGGDPFIFSRASHAILHAFHGEGVWEPVALFGDLTEMVTTLAIIGDIVETAGRLLTDDDSIILPRYQNEARERVSACLNSSERADDVLRRLGWIDL